MQALPATLPVDRLAEFDKAFGLTARGNSEIARQLAPRHRDPEPLHTGRHRRQSYLTTIGRRKLVLPLYKALLATPAGRHRAEAIYATTRPGYHPITVD